MLELIARLAGADPWQASLPAQLDAVGAWERIRGWVEAQQASWIAAAAATGRPDEPCWDEDWAREDLAVQLRVSPAAAQRRIDHAQALDGPLLAARDALATGQLTCLQAVILIEETRVLTAAQRTQVGMQLLDQAGQCTPGQFRNRTRRAVLTADPVGAAARRETAAAGRLVEQWAEPDGIAVLQARLPAEQASAVWQALTALARHWDGDGRSLDQRRADALVTLTTRTGCTGRAGGAGRTSDRGGAGRTASRGNAGGAGGPRCAGGTGCDLPPVTVSIRLDLPTALGLADQPATLPGYGPLPPALGRALAQDADWQRWLTDPATGDLLDLGRQHYRPSPALREFIQTRDGRCRFPGCTTPARHADLDHTIPHADGGPTSRANLTPLCRRHHRLKTHTPWTYQRLPDGTTEWTDPHGRHWRDPPQHE